MNKKLIILILTFINLPLVGMHRTKKTHELSQRREKRVTHPRYFKQNPQPLLVKSHREPQFCTPHVNWYKAGLTILMGSLILSPLTMQPKIELKEIKRDKIPSPDTHDELQIFNPYAAECSIDMDPFTCPLIEEKTSASSEEVTRYPHGKESYGDKCQPTFDIPDITHNIFMEAVKSFKTQIPIPTGLAICTPMPTIAGTIIKTLDEWGNDWKKATNVKTGYLAVVFLDRQFVKLPYVTQKTFLLHELYHVAQFHPLTGINVIDPLSFPKGAEQEADTHAMLATHCKKCALESCIYRYQKSDTYITQDECYEIALQMDQSQMCPFHKAFYTKFFKRYSDITIENLEEFRAEYLPILEEKVAHGEIPVF